MFLGLSLAAWFVIFIVLLVFALQIFTKLPSDFVFLGGMGLLLVSGVISTNKSLRISKILTGAVGYNVQQTLLQSDQRQLYLL